MNESTINANTVLFMVKEKDRETGHFQYRCIDDLDIKYDPGPTVVTLKLNKKWIAEVSGIFRNSGRGRIPGETSRGPYHGCRK